MGKCLMWGDSKVRRDLRTMAFRVKDSVRLLQGHTPLNRTNSLNSAINEESAFNQLIIFHHLIDPILAGQMEAIASVEILHPIQAGVVCPEEYGTFGRNGPHARVNVADV